MARNPKKKIISEQSKHLATVFIDNLMNRNNKGAQKALETMINNRISAKIRKVAQTEDLI